MTRSTTLSVITLAFCSAGLAGEKTPAAKPLDLKSLPANKWVALPTSGWRGKFWYGPGIHFGFCGAGKLGVVVYDGARRNKTGHIRDLSTAENPVRLSNHMPVFWAGVLLTVVLVVVGGVLNVAQSRRRAAAEHH